MKKLVLLGFAAAIVVLGLQKGSETNATPRGAAPADAPVAEAELRTASAKAVKLVQRSQVVWSTRETCTSCHHQLVPQLMLEAARERGVPVDERAAGDGATKAFGYLKDLDAAVQGYDFIDVYFDGWAMVGARAAGVEPSTTTAAYAQFIASRQSPDGSWPTIDDRPPQASSLFASTAVCARAVQSYLPERLEGEKEARLRRAREWLLASSPRTTEDRIFRLLGLLWTGADEGARKDAARRLLAEQREDGGWSQLPSLASDAYSTGEALVALREGSGLPADDPAYRRGLRFLLETQRPDGSWHVVSRLHPPAPVSPPYFETGFPYGHDQFVSAMGTAWAATAMLDALPSKTGDVAKRPALAGVAPAEQAEWIRVALGGSAADLERLLDAGTSVESRTAGGMTPLMLAARDPEKVKLLVARGADVNARAATGLTPLTVAARYRGNVETVRFLLKSGARPDAEKSVEVRNDASALYYAVMAGDAEMAAALLDAGARLDSPMRLLGRVPASPLLYAVFLDDTAMVALLAGRGADPNEVDGDRVSVLQWAALANHAGTVRALLARGAKVDHADRFGMTALLYAASIDYGDTEVLEALLAASPDLRAKNGRGQTALALARGYRHTAMASILASKAAAPRR